MTPEEMLKELANGNGDMLLVIGYRNGTDLIDRRDCERWEKLCAAHARGGRAIGVIAFADGAWSIRALAPFTQSAAGPYLEKIAREVAASNRACSAAVN
jgi:hypothetical protein